MFLLGCLVVTLYLKCCNTKYNCNTKLKEEIRYMLIGANVI